MKLIIEDILKISKEYLEDDYREILKEFTIFFPIILKIKLIP